MRSTARKLRYMRNRHQEWMELRTRVQLRFDRAGMWELKVQVVRATIGQVYNHARMNECIVTWCGTSPLLVPLDELEQMTRHITRGTAAKRYHEQFIAGLSRRWTTKRPKVRHPEWRRHGRHRNAD